MNPQLITIVIPFQADVERVRETLSRDWGNPVHPNIVAALDDLGTIHFLSAHALDGSPSLLVFEFAVDGSPSHTLERFAAACDAPLRTLFITAGLDSNEPARLLEVHRQELGVGWFDTPGLGFCGTPGFTVHRIRREAELAQRIVDVLSGLPRDASAAQKLQWIRAELWRGNERWAFEPEACLSARQGEIRWAVAKSIGPLVREILWPLLVLPLLAAVAGWAFAGAWVGIAASLAVFACEGFWGYRLYRRFRDQEATDLEDCEPASAEQLEVIAEREDHLAQNHLLVLTPLKAGWVRRLTLRLALFAIRQAARHVYAEGKLGDIGTIHIARWIVLPGTSQLLFLSNYGGSWESYLEDFIIKAHLGLTGIWSNTRGFPRSSNLFFDGAVRGAEFKTWARRQQLPTHCWYSAYPTLTTDRIRIHADLRRGLATAQSEADAARWVSLSGASPTENLELAQIPALAFGGLPRLRFGAGLLVSFHDSASARTWLSDVVPYVDYGEEPARQRVLQLAFTAKGLRQLGMDDAELTTFPVAFQHGSRVRARKLGDQHVKDWHWTDEAESGVDALALVYSDSDPDLAQFVNDLKRGPFSNVVEVPFEPLPEPGRPLRELFGFVDGTSQPALRGTRKALRAHPDQLLYPGEVILGYPDESGFTPPCPPGTRNGTFLVVRHIEQHRAEFEKFLEEAAAMPRIAQATPGADHQYRKGWVAAKMMGRWRSSGNSLVRNPAAPGDDGGGDNDFRYADDPNGVHCPFGAHIRRANPRDSFNPNAEDPLRIVNRHRILRVGRSYTDGSQTRGLFFMCLNADIERQFEFVQQSWILAPNFHGLPGEADPVVGNTPALTIPTESGPVAIQSLRAFVTVLGTGYFFVPSRSCLDILATPIEAAAAE